MAATFIKGAIGDILDTKQHDSSDKHQNPSANRAPSTLSATIDKEIQQDRVPEPKIDANDAGTTHSKKPRIGYRIEYRNRATGELVSEKTYEKGDEPMNTEIDGPLFELVTSYLVSMDSSNGGSKAAVPITPQSIPTHHLRIHSPAIINALQSVVRYYPSQDLSGDHINVSKPYPVLVHHYEELHQFAKQCAAKPSSELCVREKDATEHIVILLNFLDEEVMTKVREEQDRNKRGFCTYEWRWVAFKPGMTVIEQMRDLSWEAQVVHSISGGILASSPGDWIVRMWKLNYDGICMERVWATSTSWAKFDGETDEKGSNLTLFFDPTIDDSYKDNEIAKQLVADGKKFGEMVQKQCCHYRGKGAAFPHNEIDSLVMIDLNEYYAANEAPKFIGDEDLRDWLSNCVCEVCVSRKRKGLTKIEPLFSHFGYNRMEAATMSDHQHLLCPPSVMGYVFRTRTWDKLFVKNCFQPQFEENMIRHLVMSEQRLLTLKALSKSFARVDKHGNELKAAKWTADFVRGKGNGLIFLLHGKPGVGKTCTAECISEFTRRPLMVLTSSDIGIEPEIVERNLMMSFKRAMSWGAVLLIDEADIFMERRTTSDLTRNSLVAGFLRALEFYDGILFLTTNRVGSFDDAFISRVHIQLYYPDFTDDERQRVWKTFIDKLARERGDTLRLTIDAKEYIESTHKQGIKWNGREIRNAFQTAVALAEYDAEKDSEGKIMVTDNHFRAVVELSKDFKGYLTELHRRDEEKRAEDRYERLAT